MKRSPRRPVFDPHVTRSYQRSRFQSDLLVTAYESLLPILSRPLVTHQGSAESPLCADTPIDVPTTSAAGA